MRRDETVEVWNWLLNALSFTVTDLHEHYGCSGELFSAVVG